jgi:ubiquinone/menaquinone biosynthesis C-methylase UbiE
MSIDQKALNRIRYARAAEQYVASPVHASGMGLPRLLELADCAADWLVLDVATGGGHTALNFSPHAGQIVAADFTLRMLQAARDSVNEKGVQNIRWVGADAEQMPFASGSFDLVVCRVAAHHFPDIYRFCLEAQRVLKANGVLLVHDHVMPDSAKAARYINAYEKLRDPAHVRALPEYEWRGVLLDAGLVVEHSEQFTIQHELSSWAARQNCTPETIERLQVMLLRAPKKVRAWMLPEYAGTPYARYTDHQIILKARKPAAEPATE